MKTVYRSLLLSLLLSAGCSRADIPTLIAPDSRTAVDRLVTALRGGVAMQDRDRLMALMDPEYVQEQHDRLLEGRTDQFLNEFFAGTEVVSGKFRSVEVEELQRIERIDIEETDEDDRYEVEAILLTSAGTEIRVAWYIVVERLSSKQYRAWLRGTVG